TKRPPLCAPPRGAPRPRGGGGGGRPPPPPQPPLAPPIERQDERPGADRTRVDQRDPALVVAHHVDVAAGRIHDRERGHMGGQGQEIGHQRTTSAVAPPSGSTAVTSVGWPLPSPASSEASAGGRRSPASWQADWMARLRASAPKAAPAPRTPPRVGPPPPTNAWAP